MRIVLPARPSRGSTPRAAPGGAAWPRRARPPAGRAAALRVARAYARAAGPAPAARGGPRPRARRHARRARCASTGPRRARARDGSRARPAAPARGSSGASGGSAAGSSAWPARRADRGSGRSPSNHRADEDQPSVQCPPGPTGIGSAEPIGGEKGHAMSRAGSRRACGRMAVAGAGVHGAPATAAVLQSVTVQGEPVVGATVTAEVVSTDPAAPLEFRWQRCKGPQRGSCDRIKAAPERARPTRVAPAMPATGWRCACCHGRRGRRRRRAWSPLTAVVPGPAPTPTPDAHAHADPLPRARRPIRARTRPPTRTSETDDGPVGFVQTHRAARPSPCRSPTRPRRPTRRRTCGRSRWSASRGRSCPGGARISLLRVRAPSSATVDVRCDGPGCRLHRKSFGTRRIQTLERFVRARTRITIRVSARGVVGKYVRLVVRDGSAPKRRDACLLPGRGAPAPCPPA